MNATVISSSIPQLKCTCKTFMRLPWKSINYTTIHETCLKPTCDVNNAITNMFRWKMFPRNMITLTMFLVIVNKALNSLRVNWCSCTSNHLIWLSLFPSYEMGATWMLKMSYFRLLSCTRLPSDKKKELKKQYLHYNGEKKNIRNKVKFRLEQTMSSYHQ